VLPKIKAPRFNEYIGIAAKEKRKRIRAESELSLLKKQKDSLNKKVKKQHKSIKKVKKFDQHELNREKAKRRVIILKHKKEIVALKKKHAKKS